MIIGTVTKIHHAAVMLESGYRSYSLAVNQQIYKHSIKIIVYLGEDSIVINLNQIFIAALSSKF